MLPSFWIVQIQNPSCNGNPNSCVLGGEGSSATCAKKKRLHRNGTLSQPIGFSSTLLFRWPKLHMGLYRFANSGPHPRPSRAKPQQISVPRRNCMAATGVCTSHRGNSALARVSHWLSMSSFMVGGRFRYPRVVTA